MVLARAWAGLQVPNRPPEKKGTLMNRFVVAAALTLLSAGAAIAQSAEEQKPA